MFFKLQGCLNGFNPFPSSHFKKKYKMKKETQSNNKIFFIVLPVLFLIFFISVNIVQNKQKPKKETIKNKLPPSTEGMRIKLNEKTGFLISKDDLGSLIRLDESPCAFISNNKHVYYVPWNTELPKHIEEDSYQELSDVKKEWDKAVKMMMKAKSLLDKHVEHPDFIQPEIKIKFAIFKHNIYHPGFHTRFSEAARGLSFSQETKEVLNLKLRARVQINSEDFSAHIHVRPWLLDSNLIGAYILLEEMLHSFDKKLHKSDLTDKIISERELVTKNIILGILEAELIKNKDDDYILAQLKVVKEIMLITRQDYLNSLEELEFPKKE